MAVETISKKDIVLSLIKKATEAHAQETSGILGKKALQKSLYFFNLRHNIFAFKWGDYGPISGEIQQIAEDLISRRNVTVEEVSTLKKEAIIKKMKFAAENNPYFTDIKFPQDIDQTLNEVVRFIAGKSPRQLELLASVHYWAIRQQSVLEEYTDEYIFEKLSELKPDAGFTLNDVNDAIGTLEHSDYLRKQP